MAGSQVTTQGVQDYWKRIVDECMRELAARKIRTGSGRSDQSHQPEARRSTSLHFTGRYLSTAEATRSCFARF